jgi:hypothetical protein
MINKKENPSSGYSPFGVDDYFVKNVLPASIYAQERRITTPTPSLHNRDELLILVRSGSGAITVNSIRYPVKKNTIISLGPFHRYSLTPNQDQELVIAEGRMNAGTYVYILACPYYKVKNLSVPSEPAVAHLTGRLAEMACRTMDAFLCESIENREDRNKICYCYMMELFGAMTEGMSQRIKQERRSAELEDKKE